LGQLCVQQWQRNLPKWNSVPCKERRKVEWRHFQNNERGENLKPVELVYFDIVRVGFGIKSRLQLCKVARQLIKMWSERAVEWLGRLQQGHNENKSKTLGQEAQPDLQRCFLNIQELTMILR
jgi:hypothetical protein